MNDDGDVVEIAEEHVEEKNDEGEVVVVVKKKPQFQKV